MRSLLTVFGLFFIGFGLHAQNEPVGRVSERIDALKVRGFRFAPVTLFELQESSLITQALWSAACSQADVLSFDRAAAQALIREASEHILLEIPSASGSIHLELESVSITSDDMIYRTSDGSAQELPSNLHYRGVIAGSPGTLVSISVFEEEVMGIISDASGERIIGRFDQAQSGLHILYHEDHLLGRSGAVCATPEDGPDPRPEDLVIEGGARTVRCVRLYWEGGYDIVQNKGSVENATNYLLGLFNQSAILFDNDAIDVVLSELFVWNEPSPYTATSSGGRLDQFGAYRTSFNGDLAHLIDLGNYGGIAWLNTLCNSTVYRMAYSGIDPSFENVPTFSWSVEVVTHEQGHNLGSKHTHACAWNGNNTAIDGCGQSAGYSEGGCPQGPLPSSSVGGTIMSYCHLTNSTIKFVNGFGTQPTALITNRIDQSNCLLVCGSTCDSPVVSVVPSANNALISWTNMNASSYDLQWKLASIGTWTTVNGITGTSHELNGLEEGTAYNYRVRTNCATLTSAWSATGTFTTPVPCFDTYEPNNSSVAAATITLPANINALIGTSSDVDYYLFHTDQITTFNISLTNLPADYDIRLLNSAGSQVAISQNGNSQSESIIYGNAAAGTYYIHVYGWNGLFNNTICYNLTTTVSGTQGCGTPGGLVTTNITTTSASLSWNSMQGASAYDLQWRLQDAVGWTSVANISGTNHSLNGLVAGSTYDFRVRASCTGGVSLYSSIQQFTTVDDPCFAGIRVSAYICLDGAFDAGQQLMRDDLRVLGMIPLTEPYTSAGLPVDGPTTTPNATFSITGAGAIVDWVVLELRGPADPGHVVARRAGLLRRDGLIVDPADAISPINFCLPNGTYYVSVRHRNHLGCMTSAPISLSSTGTTLNFRSSATATYGINARRNVGGVMRAWAGNSNGDIMVKYSGANNDRDQILGLLGGVILTNTIQGYSYADLNLDGVVKYTGANNDRDVILTTIGGVIPTAMVTEQLP